MITLSARDAYPHWAPTYGRETVVSRLDDLLVAELGVNTRDARLLDVGCGTGRRLAQSGASLRVGVDFTSNMLDAHSGIGLLAAADMHHLPFRDRAFDVSWCRLVLGHLPSIEQAMRELGRVIETDACVVITDLAPSAYEAGHRRTFRNASGDVVEIEHFVHDADAIVGAAHGAGLKMESYRTAVVDARVEGLYAAAGAGELFERQRGEALVHAFVFRRIEP